MRKLVVFGVTGSMLLSSLVAAPITASAASAAATEAPPVEAPVQAQAAAVDERVDVRSTDPATEFWGRPRPTAPGTFNNVAIYPGKVVAQTVTITQAGPTGDVKGTAVLKAGSRTLSTSFTWTNGCNWQVDITRGSGSGGKPRNRTFINLDDVSGSITNTNCVRNLKLSVRGYRIGNKTATIKLAAIPGGFEGSKTFSKLVVGQTEYSNVTVSISTSRKYAQLDGTLNTNMGKFTISAQVSAPGGVYTQSLKVTGAKLKIEKGGVDFQDFKFSATAEIPKNGCATFTNAFGGTFKMKNRTYTINGAKMSISCGKVVLFEFKITVAHTDRETGTTKRATLALAWTNRPGQFDDLLDPSLGDSGGHIGNFSYQKGLFGKVDLSETRRFSKKYKNKTFSRSVTMGVIFGVAIYTTPKNPTGPWYAKIGAGGYFDADRVSGSFGCLYEHASSDDFTCGGELRLNPSWAGVYRAHWSGI